eukprot:3008434-Amphidinium_carterae.1
MNEKVGDENKTRFSTGKFHVLQSRNAQTFALPFKIRKPAMKQTNLFSFTRAGPNALASEEAKHALRLSDANRLGTDFPQPQQKKVGRPSCNNRFDE